MLVPSVNHLVLQQATVCQTMWMDVAEAKRQIDIFIYLTINFVFSMTAD